MTPQQHGVACNNDHILVPRFGLPSMVHIYTWGGLHTQTITHEQLGLQPNDYISAIYCSNTENPLHLCVGDWEANVRSFHGYKVNKYW